MKPKIEDLDVRQVAPPPLLPLTRLIPPQAEDDEEFMEDASEVQSVPIPPPETTSSTSEMMSPSNSAWSAPATYGPYIGPFADLGARNWFEQSHHGSPEAERMQLFVG